MTCAKLGILGEPVFSHHRTRSGAGIYDVESVNRIVRNLVSGA
jgi:hypothetical protein